VPLAGDFRYRGFEEEDEQILNEWVR
jgi:hypothetical protein